MEGGRIRGPFCGVWVGSSFCDRLTNRCSTFRTCHEWWDSFWNRRIKAPNREDRAWGMMLDDLEG